MLRREQSNAFVAHPFNGASSLDYKFTGIPLYSRSIINIAVSNMQFFVFSLPLLAVAPAFVSANEPQAKKEDELAVTFAKFLDTTWSADCRNNWKPKRNPYTHATFWESKSRAEGIAAWREYFGRLPEKCHPKPYDMAIADGKSKKEAENDQAAYEKLQEIVISNPEIVDSYFGPIQTGQTPGQAYGHWIRNRDIWGIGEWRPVSSS